MKKRQENLSSNCLKKGVHYTSLKYPAQFTYAVWLKTSSSSVNQGIMAQTAGTFIDLIIGSSKIRYEAVPIGNTGSDFNSSVISSNTWYQVVMTYNGVTMTGYLNGISQGSTNPGGSGFGSESNPLYVGLYAGLYFTGLLDDVRIYNRALSAAQISAMYNGGK